MAVRQSFPHFNTANPTYAGATVSFYTVDVTGVKTTTLAALYGGVTGVDTLANPQKLGSEGKFIQPVYIDVAVIATVSGALLADHDTGIISPSWNYRGDWTAATLYSVNDVALDGAAGANTKNLYVCNTRHTSGTFSTDKDTNSYWDLFVDAQAAMASATTSATNAATSATNAATSETNAASSATAAAVAAAANLYSAIVNKAASFSVIATDDGHLFVVDTSGGSVVVTLPDIVTDVAEGFRIGFMKASALNTLTINRVGTDTVNGGTSYVMTADTEMATLVADANTPDNWITFGASTTSAGAGLTKSGSTISLDTTFDQSWTGAQRAPATVANTGSFDMTLANNFTSTPAAAITLSFLNETAGQGGNILLSNPTGYAITLGAECTADASCAATLSIGGTYLIGYISFDGVTVRLTYSGALV